MEQNRKAKNIIVKCANDILLPITLVFGLYIILHGHLSPGGGFQGGVIVAAGVALVFLGYGNDGVRKAFRPGALKLSENIGALMYIFFCLLGILYGDTFVRNVLYALGNPGDLWSSGTIFLMNFSVGFKVRAGICLMLIIMIGTMFSQKDDE
jgi:multicomponent Na+:H+ antiporter subunit B